MSPLASIYLDCHATTPLDPRVLEAMMPYLTREFGNAASRNHRYGWAAQNAVEQARASVASLIGADPREIVFTSGATESDNLAIKGVADLYGARGRHIVTAATEHRAVLDTCRRLESAGFEVTCLGVDQHGLVDPGALEAALRPTTILVSIMTANNEVGTIQPIAELGAICKARGILLHTDATQAAGRIPLDVERMAVDLASISAHKMYGPKGVGALYVRRSRPRVRLSPLLDGGGHERGMRSGTVNVPGVVGMGKACAIAREALPQEGPRIGALRDRLLSGLCESLPEVHLNGHPSRRLPGNLNVSFAGIDSEALMMGISEIAVSSGAACSSATLEPSHVLRAMGVPEDLVHGSIRFGLGRFTTPEEIETALERVASTVEGLRAQSPSWQRRIAQESGGAAGLEV